jgi:hypothetical protein
LAHCRGTFEKSIRTSCPGVNLFFVRALVLRTNRSVSVPGGVGGTGERNLAEGS